MIIPEGCLELGLLDIWGDDKQKIFKLSQQDIINDVNTVTHRYVFIELIQLWEFVLQFFFSFFHVCSYAMTFFEYYNSVL